MWLKLHLINDNSENFCQTTFWHYKMEVKHCVSEEDIRIIHKRNFAQLCRLCLKLLGNKRHEIKKYVNDIAHCFNIKISFDIDTCHPKYMS